MSVTRLCTHCGYHWTQRKNPDQKPRQCPYCKSPKWDQEYHSPVKPVAPAPAPTAA